MAGQRDCQAARHCREPEGERRPAATFELRGGVELFFVVRAVPSALPLLERLLWLSDREQTAKGLRDLFTYLGVLLHLNPSSEKLAVGEQPWIEVVPPAYQHLAGELEVFAGRQEGRRFPVVLLYDPGDPAVELGRWKALLRRYVERYL